MYIAHIASSISRTGAGVSKVVRDLAEAQAKNGDTIHIITLMDQFTHVDQPNNPGITLSACPVTFSRRFGYSHSLKQSLSYHVDSIDVYHMHGLWMHPNWVVGNIARKMAIPYIISPHGMLEPWGLDRSRWKKKIAGLLFEYNNLANAHCLHACSEKEAQNFRHFGYKGPIALAPLGLTRGEFAIASLSTTDYAVDISQLDSFANKNVLLYLSRLHVKKGLELLLDAWQSIGSDFPGWHLVIAGDGDPAYIVDLLGKACELGVTDSVTFIGSVHGDDKWSLLKRANIFVLPTYSENFGLVVVEALACGVPVITTKGAPWYDLVTEECGWWINIGKQALEECLISALSLNNSQLIDMGERGRHLVEEKYMIDISAHTMRGVYEWILNGGAVPDCLRFD